LLGNRKLAAAVHEQRLADLFDAQARELDLLSEVEHALEKLRDGTNGLCEGSEEPLGVSRLHAARGHAMASRIRRSSNAPTPSSPSDADERVALSPGAGAGALDRG